MPLSIDVLWMHMWFWSVYFLSSHLGLKSFCFLDRRTFFFLIFLLLLFICCSGRTHADNTRGTSGMFIYVNKLSCFTVSLIYLRWKSLRVLNNDVMNQNFLKLKHAVKQWIWVMWKPLLNPFSACIIVLISVAVCHTTMHSSFILHNRVRWIGISLRYALG